MNNAEPSVSIGVSACLLGEAVRYDGGHKRAPLLSDTLASAFQFVRFCPEMAAGLGVPRATIDLHQVDGRLRALQNTGSTPLDVTERLNQTLHALPQAATLNGFVLKSRSPSCGVQSTPVYEQGKPTRNDGSGLFAAALQQHHPDLPLLESDALASPMAVDAFLTRAATHARLRQLTLHPTSLQQLMQFHQHHKYLLMAYDPHGLKQAGHLLAGWRGALDEGAMQAYRSRVLNILAKPFDPGRHINACQHMLGYLPAGHRAAGELARQLQLFAAGELSLQQWIDQASGVFTESDLPYIRSQVYWQPYPKADAIRALVVINDGVT